MPTLNPITKKIQLGAFLILTTTLLVPRGVLGGIKDSVVKIYTTYDRHSYGNPWRTRGQSSRTGSGAIINGSRILTNAHIVSDHTFIQVRRAGQSDKFSAAVKWVSNELDLALLEVEDAAFFKGARPLKIGTLPRVGDSVVVYGFPEGGTRLTVTEGVVSRIDRTSYVHSQYHNLTCQIDAAINPGSSGGPVIVKGKIAGVSFQSQGGQNIGFIVPAIVIRHFFQDIKDGQHDGAPSFPLVWQNLENNQIRNFYDLPKDLTGILVTEVSPLYSGEEKILPQDIILSIDGLRIASDGTIAFRKGERIAFTYIIDSKQVKEWVKVKLWRKGETIERVIQLAQSKVSYGYLVPRMRYGVPPTYYVTGGLVFSPLTANYLNTWDEWDKLPIVLENYYREIISTQNQDRKDVVVLINVLPDAINVGYVDMADKVISEVNGVKIKSISDLVQAFEGFKGENHRLVLEPYNSEIVLSEAQLKKRSPLILEKYGVTADRSSDLQ